MKLQNFSRFEKKSIRKTNIENAMAGKGIYVYENSSKHADLTLPKSTATGVRTVKAGGRFQGDDYFMQLVRTGDLRLVEVLDKGDPVVVENKLILDQPETVTPKGTVEQVQVNPNAKKPVKKSLKEQTGPTSEQPVLLVEAPEGCITEVKE